MSTILYIISAIFLKDIFNTSFIISSSFAYFISFLFSYLINNYFVFGVNFKKIRTISRFAITSSFGFLLTSLIVYLADRMGLSYYLAILVVVVIMPIINYTVNLRWTWADSNQEIDS